MHKKGKSNEVSFFTFQIPNVIPFLLTFALNVIHLSIKPNLLQQLLTKDVNVSNFELKG